MPTILGGDAHKHIHQAVAIDDGGRERDQWRGANPPTAWQHLQTWAADWPGEVTWGIEGSGQDGRGLAQQLVATGALVVEVNPRQTAALRRGGRRRGKTDRLDALAVARVVRQAGPTLPRGLAEDATAGLAVLVAERDAVLAEATRIRNHLHQLLLQLSFVTDQVWPDLTDATAVAQLSTSHVAVPDPRVQIRLASVRRLAGRRELALGQAATIRQEIETRARQVVAPLLTLPGVGALTAGMRAAHRGCGQRFATDAQLAMYAGTAPLEASRGARARHRLNRTGDRPLNAIIHRIALGQSRCYPPAMTSLARRHAEGKTNAEALRARKRFIPRAICHRWQQCHLPPSPAT